LGIVNDSKYSYSFDIDEMTMTILKNSVYAHHDPKKLDPQEDYDYVDDGIQEMTYALVPHDGGWKDSEVIHRAMEINFRPVTIIETFHEGKLPQLQSFADVDRKEIVISALKESEDKEGIILRAYETMKQKVKATFNLPFMDRTFTMNFTPCEIKTIKIPYDKDAEVIEVNMLEM
jgi:alpha-mannosidase